MSPLVLDPVASIGERGAAHTAHVRALARVDALMATAMAGLGEPFPAVLALVRPLPSVTPLVLP